MADSRYSPMSRFTLPLSAWMRRHPEVTFSLALVVLMRVWFALWGAAIILSRGGSVGPTTEAAFHGITPLPQDGLWLLIAPWQRFDTVWYMRIAEMGYSGTDASAAYFPLLPILMRGLGTLLGSNYLLAGLLLNTVAVFCAFILLYRLAAQLADPPTAERTLLFWATFPTAFYLFSGYAEPMLAALALASLYFALRQNWWAAGFASAGATLARPVGLLIALPLAIEAWRASPLWRERLKGLGPLLAVGVAMSLWTLYLYLAFGDALLWANAQKVWETTIVFPGQTILLAIEGAIKGKIFLGNTILNLSLTLVVLVAILAGLKKVPLSFSLYALTMLVVPFLTYYPISPVADAGRRAMVIFPAFIALAMVLRRSWQMSLWVAVSATLQALLFAQFVLWIWTD